MIRTSARCPTSSLAGFSKDWRYLVAKSGSIHISINLPLAFFTDANAVEVLRMQFPNYPAFDGLTVEVDSSEVVQNLPLAIEAAHRLRFHNIGLSIDDVGTEWPALAAPNEFPFAEIKLDRKFAGRQLFRAAQAFCLPPDRRSGQEPWRQDGG